MPEINIENNWKNKVKKIPLIIIFLILLGGIFLFAYFSFFFHQDKIDDFISEKAILYSHWQMKKINKQNQLKIHELIEKIPAEQKFLPANLKNKLRNSSEFAAVYFNEQWIFIFLPKNTEIFENKQFIYQNYIFEGISDKKGLNELINENKSLGKNPDYKKSKKTDTSLINIYISNFAKLPFGKETAFSSDISENSFWQINLTENSIKMESNIKNENLCSNNLNINHSFNYKYYINNIYTNSLKKQINLLKSINTCIDMVIFNDSSWVILLEKNQAEIIKNQISSYLANKYPTEKQHLLPDKTKAIHFIADENSYKWENNGDYLSCGNENEKYYIFKKDNYIGLSQKIQSLNKLKEGNEQNSKHLTNCELNGSISSILSKQTNDFDLNNIQVRISPQKTIICID